MEYPRRIPYLAYFALALTVAPFLPALAQIAGDTIAINKTPIVGGTNGNCLYDNSGKVGEQACGSAPSGAAGGSLGGTYPNPTVVTNANLTGDVTSVGNATTLAAGSASNLNSGTLAAARGGAGTINGALKGSGAGVVSQAACADLSNGTTNCSAAVGQLPGTTTNDNAAAGKIGQIVTASGAETGLGQISSTVTITNASPAVITWGTTTPFASDPNGVDTCSIINFTTSGALPTGLTVGTNYYVGGASISGNTFSVATTCENAIARTYVNTSSAGSGTQTGVPTGILAGAVINLGGMALTAGDWDVSSDVGFISGAATSISSISVSTSLVTGTLNYSPGRAFLLATAAEVPGLANNIYHAGPSRYSLASTTTVFCPVAATFTIGTLAAWGGCHARRVR